MASGGGDDQQPASGGGDGNRALVDNDAAQTAIAADVDASEQASALPKLSKKNWRASIEASVGLARARGDRQSRRARAFCATTTIKTCEQQQRK